MKDKDTITTETVSGALRERAEQLLLKSSAPGNGNDEESVRLFNELELYELELQLQNEELKASHQSLEIERMKFGELFNAAPVGYLILDEDGFIREINQTGSSLLYIPRGSISGTKFEAFIVKDSLHTFNAFFTDLATAEERLSCEVRIKTKNTLTKYVQLDGIKGTSALYGYNSYYVTITDVTQTKKSQQALWETTERLNQTLKASLTGTWMVKARGKAIFLDGYSKDILNVNNGVEQPDLLSLIHLFVEEDRPKLDFLFSNCVDNLEIDLQLRLKQHRKTPKIILVKGKAVHPLYGESYFAGILTDITDRVRNLEIAEENEKFNRRMLRKAAIEAQEKERSRISAALHDSVCQTLYGIRFNLGRLNKQKVIGGEFDNINFMLNEAINELRTISVELTPSILKDFGFTAGINDMVQRLNQIGFKVNTTIDKRSNLLSKETQLYTFRIIQELLNNSIKHSGTNSATVNLCMEKDEVNIVVKDEGQGFAHNLEDSFKQGSGLRGIKNRVSLLNGKIEIKNEKGAHFTISFPAKD